MLDVSDDVGRFLDSLYDPGERRYRFASDRPATLLSSCFALMTQALLDRSSPHATAALERIASEQVPDGSFLDTTFRPEDTRGSHSEAYIRWQFCFFALAALDLHRTAARPLEFMEPFLKVEAVERWLDERRWNRFWYASNEIMFLLYFLSYLWRRQGVTQAHSVALHVLDVLDARQDPLTGYWGTDQKLANKMYGAAHLYMFYDFFERSIHFPERIIDTTLGLQLDNGLYGQRFGGACEDYDGIEVLAKVSRVTEHRHHEVRQALKKTADTIRARKASGSGFAYRLLPTSFRAFYQLRLKLEAKDEYRYSGWNGMRARVWEPDTWGTLFRCLSLLVADDTLGESVRAPHFYELPAWGYHRRRAGSVPGASHAAG